MDVDRINDVFVVSVYDGISMNDFHEFGSPKEAVMTSVNRMDTNTTRMLNMEVCYSSIVVWVICVMIQSSRWPATLPLLPNLLILGV